MEEWKDVIGYEGKYQVSNLGNVRSLDYMHTGNAKELKQYTNRYGYKMVRLCKNGDMKAFSVHKLVAMSFIPNPNNYPQVNHKDCNPLNNKVDNLEWCTAEYNNTYNNKHIRALETRMKKHIGCRKILQLNENEEIIKEYFSISQASKEMKVSNQAISDCLRGIQKHSAGYKWKYADEELQK